MTQQQLFVVWDNRAQAVVGLPFIQRHDAAAIRTFGDAFKNPNAGLAQHPADFDLYSIGVMGEESPTITADTRFLVNGATLVAATSTEDNDK